ncbi:MAG: hypothetical protein PWP15_1100 [Methanothermococcus sp.]|uniref:phage minor head protein n=1 Tax=Methanothermococcus sp. TaxID=2614238 RepID=UPI0025849640|nr:phage minor head protein [Methanothermococcus sp.]MDK2790593.1 hypothetical protein [Methanothermococcus sp.]
MTIEEWKRKLLDELTADTEKRLKTATKDALKQVQGSLSEYYAKYGKEGVIPQEAFLSYKRNLKMEEQLQEIATKLNNLEFKTIQDANVELYREIYNLTGYDLFARTGINSITFTTIPKDTVLLAIQNPVQELTLKSTMETHRREIVRQLRIQLTTQILNGRGYREVAEQAAYIFNGDYNKALRVLRTENRKVKTIAELDSLEAELKKRPNMKATKTWITAIDGRERDSHRAMNGTTIERDEEFILPLARGQGPAALTGDPSEIVNCRCALEFNVEFKDEFLKSPTWQKERYQRWRNT